MKAAVRRAGIAKRATPQTRVQGPDVGAGVSGATNLGELLEREQKEWDKLVEELGL